MRRAPRAILVRVRLARTRARRRPANPVRSLQGRDRGGSRHGPSWTARARCTARARANVDGSNGTASAPGCAEIVELERSLAERLVAHLSRQSRTARWRGLVTFHEAAVADHGGGEDHGELALHGLASYAIRPSKRRSAPEGAPR